jgi:hypothetical protein
MTDSLLPVLGEGLGMRGKPHRRTDGINLSSPDSPIFRPDSTTG